MRVDHAGTVDREAEMLLRIAEVIIMEEAVSADLATVAGCKRHCSNGSIAWVFSGGGEDNLSG